VERKRGDTFFPFSRAIINLCSSSPGKPLHKILVTDKNSNYYSSNKQTGVYLKTALMLEYSCVTKTMSSKNNTIPAIIFSSRFAISKWLL
jgi:hypothetical protein